jgi:hypothetical protein
MDAVRLCKSINHTWKNGVQNTTDLPSKKWHKPMGACSNCRVRFTKQHANSEGFLSFGSHLCLEICLVWLCPVLQLYHLKDINNLVNARNSKCAHEMTMRKSHWEIVKPLDPWWSIWCAIWRSNHCNLVEENWAFSYKLSSSFLWGSLSCATSCSDTTS